MVWPKEGWGSLEARVDKKGKGLKVGPHSVMEDWERPLMKRMAKLLCQATGGGTIMEVGFGLGISAGELQKAGVRRHIIVEPHPTIFQRLEAWKARRPTADIVPVNDYWQNAVRYIPKCNGIFFDTFGSTDPKVSDENIEFLATAGEKLPRGGAIALFWANPVLDDVQQIALYKYFSRVIIEPVPLKTKTNLPVKRVGFLPAILAIK